MNKLYIYGTGHCGSTLLAQCLGRHSQIVNAGELVALGRYLKRNEVCTCRKQIWVCPFWERVASFADAAWHNPDWIDQSTPKGWIARATKRLQQARFLTATHDVMDAISLAAEKPFLVDASKSLKRLRLLLRSQSLQWAVVALVRHPGHWVTHRPDNEMEASQSLEQKAAAWARAYGESLEEIESLRPGKLITLRYEDFAQCPECALWEVVPLLGAKYEDAMLSLDPVADHQIRGNAIRFDSPKPIRLIESWREKLTAAELATIRSIAGPVMEKFGYE